MVYGVQEDRSCLEGLHSAGSTQEREMEAGLKKEITISFTFLYLDLNTIGYGFRGIVPITSRERAFEKGIGRNCSGTTQVIWEAVHSIRGRKGDRMKSLDVTGSLTVLVKDTLGREGEKSEGEGKVGL